MGDLLDAPNQQVVRADGSAPWEEGSGGSATEPDSIDADVDPEDSGNGLTKAELLERARELGATPANAAMSKAELQAAVDAKLAESTET